MMGKIQTTGTACVKCGGRLWPHAKFCHHCGRAVSSRRPQKRTHTKRVCKANSNRKIIAGALVTIAIVIGTLYSIHYSGSSQSQYVSTTQPQWPITPSQSGNGGGVTITGETAPASTSYQPPIGKSYVNLDITHEVGDYGPLYDGSGWRQDENDQPYATVDVQFTIRNVGTATARDVSLTLNVDGKLTNLRTIQSLSPSSSYQFSQTISLHPQHFDVLESGRYVQLFDDIGATVQLTAKTADGTWTEDFTESAPRNLSYSFTVTPNDPVVKSLVNNILSAKAWWGIRPDWEVLYDWVNDEIYYNHDKLNNWPYNFWTQLPRETIQWRKGVCIDTAVLLASMLRAAGYGPDEVYVVIGRVPIDEILSGEEAWHAWVILKESVFGVFEYWQLLETTLDYTPGFVGVINGTLSQITDAISQALFGSPVFYSEVYEFNDVNYIKLSNPGRGVSANESAVPTGMINNLRQTFWSKLEQLSYSNSELYQETTIGSSSSTQNQDLRNHVQATVDSLRVSGLSREQMEQYKDHLLDYYVDSLSFPLPIEGCENPVNMLIFVNAGTKDESMQAILSMFKQLGYFSSDYRLEFFSTIYPTNREIELYREFSIGSTVLQFHMRGMYVCETDLGYLWAVCGHLEYSDTEPIDHLFSQITQRIADSSEHIVWPNVKWESFEEDVKLQLLNLDEPSVSYVASINYGNSGYYEKNDEYHFGDGILPVIVIENV